MDLDTFVVIVFCLIDDRLYGERIRQRGPKPKLSDSEVLTIEVMGEFLGVDTDQGLLLQTRSLPTCPQRIGGCYGLTTNGGCMQRGE